MKKEVKVQTGDQTAHLREIFPGGTKDMIVAFPESKEILSEGVLPGDKDLYPLGLSGEHGIIRIEGDINLTIEGNNATIYADNWLVDNLDTNNDGIADDDRDGDGVLDQPGYRDRIVRACIKGIGDTGTIINNLNYTSDNDRSRHKELRPEFDTQREFDHYLRLYDSKGLTLKGGVIKFIWGDGAYVSGNNTEDVKIIDLTIDWNGRQGVAIAGGKRLLFDGINILNSRRGGFDFESPLKYQITDGAIVQNCYINAGLLAFPMAGSGRCDNVLIQNNLHHASGITLCRATNGATKKNIIFSGNTNVGSGGSYNFVGVENILIEGENQTRKPGKESLGILRDCKNVWIRNTNFKHEKGKDFYFELYGTTNPEDVHMYGNAANINFIKVHETYPNPAYDATDPENIEDEFLVGYAEIIKSKESNAVEGIPFEVDPFVLEYYGKATKEVKVIESSEGKERELVVINETLNPEVAAAYFEDEASLENLLLKLIADKEEQFDATGYFYLYKEVGKYSPDKSYFFEYIARDKVYEFNLTIGTEVEIPEQPIPETAMKPNKVQNFRKAWDSGSTLRLEWDKVEDATSYILNRRKDGGKWKEEEITDTAMNLVGGGSKNPGIWDLEIAAKNEAGESEKSYLTIDTGAGIVIPEPIPEPEPETETPEPAPIVIDTKEKAYSAIEEALEFLKKLNGIS